MLRRTSGWWILALAVAAAPAGAWNAGYSNGFEPWPAAARALVRPCPVERDGRTLRATCDWKARRLPLTLEFDQGWDGTLTIDGSVYESVPEPGAWGAEVYVTDLNRDGQPDFLFVMPGGGAGLAGESCRVLVAWSGTRRYRVVDFLSMGFGPEDVLDADRDGRAELVQTAFTRADSNDGQSHSYWAHRLLEVHGDRLRPRPGLAPVFIQLTFRRPNHRPTTKLTPARQREVAAERYLFPDPGGCESHVEDERRDRDGNDWTLVESFCRADHERRFEVFERPSGGARQRVLSEARGFEAAPGAGVRLLDLDGDGRFEVEIRDRAPGGGPADLYGRAPGRKGPLSPIAPPGKP